MTSGKKGQLLGLVMGTAVSGLAAYWFFGWESPGGLLIMFGAAVGSLAGFSLAASPQEKSMLDQQHKWLQQNVQPRLPGLVKGCLVGLAIGAILNVVLHPESVTWILLVTGLALGGFVGFATSKGRGTQKSTSDDHISTRTQRDK